MLRFSDAISVVRSRVASSQAQMAKPPSWNKASRTAKGAAKRSDPTAPARPSTMPPVRIAILAGRGA